MSNRIVFELHQLNNFSQEERDKFVEAIRLAEDVLNSIEFKNRFLNLPLVQTNGNTNKQIYNQLMSGADKFNKESDSDIDVYITLYYSFRNTVGYTYPSTWWTWINRKFFSSFDFADVAGNVVHEYAHNLGYDHIRASDIWSVPYAIGYLVRDMIKEKIKYGRYLTQYEIITGEIVDLNDNVTDNAPQVVYTKSLWSRIKSILFNIFR